LGPKKIIKDVPEIEIGEKEGILHKLKSGQGAKYLKSTLSERKGFGRNPPPPHTRPT
jgi:hypothetical protein